jgi:ACT domain-containing protein
MMMIVDMSHTEKPFEQISDEIAAVGTNTGVQIKCQLEGIFNMMHRV